MIKAIIVATLAFSPALHAADVNSIEVFTTEGANYQWARFKAAAKGASIAVYPVDTIALAQEEMTRMLPSDIPIEKIVLAAKEISQTTEWAAQTERLRRGWDSIFAASGYGIDRVPAIVFDGQFIVYGEAPIKALHIYRRYLAKQR